MGYYTLPPGFDLARAAELGSLLDNAYDQYNKFNQGQPWATLAGYTLAATLQATEPWKLSHFPWLPIPPPQPVPFGFVATRDGSQDIFVIIRGTITPLEWLDDFTIQPVPFAQGWGNTTQGFNSIYTQLIPGILAALGNLQNAGLPLTNIYITGHSLGAALAHLAAAGIYIGLNAKSISYTYCGPRAGDPAFANSHDQTLTTWRIFNTEDIVPTVPPATAQLETQNAGMHGLTPITVAIPQLLKLFGGQYQHVGYPVAVTNHQPTIASNHNLDIVVNELTK
jgi:hypothetical protein